MAPLPKLEGILCRFNQLKQFLPVTDTGQYREGLQNGYHVWRFIICYLGVGAGIRGSGVPLGRPNPRLGFLGSCERQKEIPKKSFQLSTVLEVPTSHLVSADCSSMLRLNLPIIWVAISTALNSKRNIWSYILKAQVVIKATLCLF